MHARPAVLPVSSGIPLLVVAGVLWGTGGLLGSLLGAATGLSPLAVAGYRLLTGGVLLLAVCRRLPRGRDAWRRTVITALLAAQFQACYFGAVAQTSVSLATLVTIGVAPVLVLLVEQLRGRPASGRTAAAAGLAVVGLALLVGLPAPGSGNVAAGAGLALLSAAGFAGLTVLGARPVPGLDAVTATGTAFALGGMVVFAAAVPLTGVGFVPTPAGLGLLLAFAILPTALAYTCFFRGLRTAPASVGAVVALLEPLTAAVLAAVVLGERLGAPGLVGAVLIGAAVVLVSRAGAMGRAARSR